MGRFKQLVTHILAGGNVASIAMMLLVGYSYCINPLKHPDLSLAGLLFPVFLAINFMFLVFWAVFKIRYILIPVTGFLICYHPVRLYSPLNIKRDIPQGTIKVLSYNVQSFGYEVGEKKRNEENEIVKYIATSNADIICLQEAQTWNVKNELDSLVKTKYRYTHEEMKDSSGEVLRIYTNYPIIAVENIEYASYGNMSMAYFLNINGDTVLVVNNHLESNMLSTNDKSNFKYLVKGKLKENEMRTESNLLIKKLSKAARKRAPQAQAVARYISKHSKYSVIVCGDFNESPISYTRNTIAKDLKDCYVNTGNGPGWSYHRSGIYVRIDNIMCSDDFDVFQCTVDNTIKRSDHYPITCRLKKRNAR